MRRRAKNGFTLLELTLSMGMLTVVAGAGFMLLNSAQNPTFNNAELTSMYSSVRSATPWPDHVVRRHSHQRYYRECSLRQWLISRGNRETVDPGPNQEIVRVNAVGGSSFTICTALPTATAPIALPAVNSRLRTPQAQRRLCKARFIRQWAPTIHLARNRRWCPQELFCGFLATSGEMEVLSTLNITATLTAKLQARLALAPRLWPN